MALKRQISNRNVPIFLDHWNFLPIDCAIKSLAVELKNQIAHEFDTIRWKQTGHAFVIEHACYEEVEKLLPALTAAAGFAYRHISRLDIVNEVRDWLPDTITKVPTIFVLEPGMWLGNHDLSKDYKTDFIGESEGSMQDFWSFRATLAEHIQRTLPSYPVVLITTVVQAD